jgi:acyl-CoA reductase-like NAD-dependent aldehyde dehydrogenase
MGWPSRSGRGAGPIADEFFASDEVRAINLIGGVKTARVLAERAGRTLKRTILELGGYNPMIVLDDVDVDYAVRMATFGSFFHQGQLCLSTRKIIIQRRIYDEFLDKFVARTKTLPAGDPLDPRTIIGPLVHQGAVDVMDQRVAEAVSLGATVRTGGTHQGLVYEPTILTDVPYEATASNEETFGPLVVVEAVDTPEDAVDVANRTHYGLTSSILAGDAYKAFELAPKLLHGVVNVNSATFNDEIHAPIGGVRESGWGRTGPDSIADFTDIILDQHHSQQAPVPVLGHLRCEDLDVCPECVKYSLDDFRNPRGRLNRPLASLDQVMSKPVRHSAQASSAAPRRRGESCRCP